MNWANSFLSKNCGNPIFGQIFGTEDQNWQQNHPIRANVMYAVNLADTLKKHRKPCLQTDRVTDGRTDTRVNPVYPIPPSMERGYHGDWTILIKHWTSEQIINVGIARKFLFQTFWDIWKNFMKHLNRHQTGELLIQSYEKFRGLANCGWINIELASYQHRKSYCKIKTI